MMQEIRDGVDIHTENAINFFGSKDYRQDCKVFNFRMIYGGSPYSFFMDSKMPNFSKKKWDGIVDTFYGKYKGLAAFHDNLMKEVRKNGYIINPTGRKLVFEKVLKHGGYWDYNKPNVVNYPVQSLATADIVPLAMVVARRRLAKYPDVKFIMQVHDSLIWDAPKKDVDVTARTCVEVFRELPDLIEQFFGFEFNVPLSGEAKVGKSWAACKDYDIN